MKPPLVVFPSKDGVEVALSPKGISLCQCKYCMELLTYFGLITIKPASTPLNPNVQLNNDSGFVYANVLAYRYFVGRLLWLTTTRPNCFFANQQLSQFMASPIEAHYKVGL